MTRPYQRPGITDYPEDMPQTSREFARLVLAAAAVVVGAIVWIVILATAVGP